MSKAKKSAGETILESIVVKKKERDFSILEASVKDDFCNYQFEVTSGVGIGDRHGVKGAGFVKDSLKDSMAELNVHFAIIDDVFKNAGINDDIHQLKSHEFTFLYSVNGFKIKNESISLTASKYLSSGGRVSYPTPYISFDELSSYKWYNELKKAADNIREEVALYREGNCIPVQEDEITEDKNQIKISFSTKEDKDDMSDFENVAE